MLDDFSEFCNTFIVPIHDLYSLLFLEQKMFLVHCMLIVCYTFFFLCCKWMLSANCLCVQKMHFEDAIPTANRCCATASTCFGLTTRLRLLHSMPKKVKKCKNYAQSKWLLKGPIIYFFVGRSLPRYK